jgi:conjugative transposon TraN protein
VYPLAITLNKTTSLVFPYAIKSVDKGSQSVLVQKAKGVENILQIKAGKEGFEETNLTVITTEGKLYCFLLNYATQPSVLNLSFGIAKPSVKDAFFSSGDFNEGEIQAYSNAVSIEKKKMHGIKDKKYGMRLRLDGLFIRDNVMYYRIKMENQSNINYDIDQVRFYIRDRKKAKRTATQEIEIKPLYVQNDTPTIKGLSEHIFVFALPKFTIPDQKYLAVQLMEKNGGRHLELNVKNRKIAKAVQIESGLMSLCNEKSE